MHSIHVAQRVRPASYGIVVQPDDRGSLLRAVGLNTLLWGGISNPLLPADRPNEVFNLSQVFDPDYIINLSGRSLEDRLLQAYDRRIIDEGQIFGADLKSSHRVPRIGINILPLLKMTYERETRFLTGQSRAAIVSTTLPEPWPTYVAIQFGTFSSLPGIGDQLSAAFVESLKAQQLLFNPGKDLSTFDDVVSPIQFTAKGLRRHWSMFFQLQTVIFVGVTSNLYDLLCYWNLRASGREVWFLDAENYVAQEEALKEIISRSVRIVSLASEPGLLVQKAESVSDVLFSEIGRWITTAAEPLVKDKAWRVQLNTGESGPLSEHEVALWESESGVDASLLEEERMTPIKPMVPSILDEDDVRQGWHRWVIELRFGGAYTQGEHLLNIPRLPGIDRLLRTALPFSTHGARVTRQGLALTVNKRQSLLYMAPVRTHDVFEAMFSNAGFTLSESLPGQCTRNIVKKMGSLIRDCKVFRLRGVRDILGRLGDGSCLTKGNMVDIIKCTVADKHGANWREELYSELKLGSSTNHKSFPYSEVIRILQSRRLIRPGLRFQCGSCYSTTWYHISEFDEEYTCRYCFTRQRVDFANKHEWQYKADGLFQLQHGGYGSLSVIISLIRLMELTFPDGGYCTSLELVHRSSNAKCELDYVCISGGRLNSKETVAFGQAKSFCDYTEDQIVKMQRLADVFEKEPFLVFSSLKDSFSPNEKALFRRSVESGYKMVLLTREDLDPPHLDSRFEAASLKPVSDLAGLSSNTIALNLPM